MADRKKTTAKGRGTRRPARPARRTNAETAARVASIEGTAVGGFVPDGLPGKLTVLGSQLHRVRVLALRAGRIAFPLAGRVDYLFPADAVDVRVSEALGLGNVREGSKGSEDAPRRTYVSQACSELMDEAEALIGFLQAFNDGLEAALPVGAGDEKGSDVSDRIVSTVGEKCATNEARSAVSRVRPQW
jgi:hypothetical protein